MTRLDSLHDIKDTAVKLQETLLGSDIEAIKMAEEAWYQLVDRFYQVEENLAPNQYEASKKDFEYFMRLVDLAMAYYRDGVEGGKRATADEV